MVSARITKKESYFRGKWWEEFVLVTLKYWGYDVKAHELATAPYDIILSDGIFIEVKSSLEERGALWMAETARLDCFRIAVACWGPLTEIGARERCKFVTVKGKYKFTVSGFQKALRDLGFPAKPDELSPFLKRLYVSGSYKSYRCD